MKGFKEITEYEAIAVAGGRDPNVAKLIELIGYGVGALMRYLKTLKNKNPTVAVIVAIAKIPYTMK
jgi:hypothetical protein